MKFFSLDSPFYKYGTILFDMIALNVLWLMTSVFSLGILMPLSNAALFHSVYHTIVEDEGYMSKSYFGVFKDKFLRGIGLFFIAGILNAICIFNIYIAWQGIGGITFLIPLYLMILFEITITTLFAYALMGETDMTVKQLLKFGFLLSNKHLLTSILCVIIIVGILAAILLINPMLILIIISVGFWLMSLLIHKRCFSKYYLDKLAG